MRKVHYDITRVSSAVCAEILNKYHYLKDISKGFKSGYNYGLMIDELCVGVCIFTGFPVPELSTGMLGLSRDDQDGLFELSRLCLLPNIQGEDNHNMASWFVARVIRQLRKDITVRVILSYADADFHSGTVYRACNFKYYGLSASKKDFWIGDDSSGYVKHVRGPMKGLSGEWRPRSRKHRFVMVFDKTLNVKWEEKDYE